MDKSAAATGKSVVDAIQHAIENEYYTELKLKDFASKYYMNACYLSGLFLSETGMNFSDYVTQTRLRKAREFLEFSELSSEQIAELAGFCTRSYFSGVFTKKIGVSPSEYRKRCRANKKSHEEYIYVSLFKNDPMIIGQDVKGLKLFADECNVISLIEAPEVYERNMLKSVIEKVISRRPAGLMISAVDEICIPYIDQAMEAGIPTVTVDCDCPESNRLATITSDWHEIGRLQADHLAKALNYCGQIAVLYMKGPHNVACGIESFTKEIGKYPRIEIIGFYNDISDPRQSEKIAYELLESHPALSAVAAFDSNSAPGFCAALKQRGLIGKVKVVSVDVSPPLIDLLAEGSIDTLIGQKRELFTYFGGKLLYAYNHSGLSISPNIKGFHVNNIPCRIDTGVFVLKKENLMRR